MNRAFPEPDIAACIARFGPGHRSGRGNGRLARHRHAGSDPGTGIDLAGHQAVARASAPGGGRGSVDEKQLSGVDPVARYAFLLPRSDGFSFSPLAIEVRCRHI